MDGASLADAALPCAQVSGMANPAAAMVRSVSRRTKIVMAIAALRKARTAPVLPSLYVPPSTLDDAHDAHAYQKRNRTGGTPPVLSAGAAKRDQAAARYSPATQP